MTEVFFNLCLSPAVININHLACLRKITHLFEHGGETEGRGGSKREREKELETGGERGQGSKKKKGGKESAHEQRRGRASRFFTTRDRKRPKLLSLFAFFRAPAHRALRLAFEFSHAHAQKRRGLPFAHNSSLEQERTMAAALSSSRSASIASSSTSSSPSTSSATPLRSIIRSTTPSLRAAAASPSATKRSAARIVTRATPTREKADATPPSGFPLPTESSADDRGSLFPRRNPGSFPSPALASALERLSIELLEGADTGAVSPPGGGEAAFDPLRDGPARYLGYSNECGYVDKFFLVFFLV